jgi:hypothetical protein
MELKMSKNNPDFKALREEIKKQNGIEKIPQLEELLNAEDSLIPSLVKKQDIEKLEELAKTCNFIANIIDTIVDAYIETFDGRYGDSTRNRDNQDRIKLLKIRNNCYFNIGLIHKEKGNTIDALLYFYDAFRLSRKRRMSWSKDNTLYKAEIEIKNLLGSKSGTYVAE